MLDGDLPIDLFVTVIPFVFLTLTVSYSSADNRCCTGLGPRIGRDGEAPNAPHAPEADVTLDASRHNSVRE